MKRFRFITPIALTVLIALSATSCTDWLTLYPQDRVVEENFWEDKNDLEGVRYAAYQQMGNTLEKLIIWGDLRSDAYQINPAITSEDKSFVAFQNITEGKLDSTMSQYDWGGIYTTINFCNKVLQHGEEVLQRDAQFTRTEWNEIKAEMTAMRALNYFYLLRSFKDIPYSTKVINSDEEVMAFPATNQLAVLDTLIMDVRAVAGKGRNRFENKNGVDDTHGLMTNTAIYALLAEMYLWRGALREGRGFDKAVTKMDNDSVIYFGQLSLDALHERNSFTTYGAASIQTDDYGSGLLNAELISNKQMGAQYKNKISPTVNSYDYIFYYGSTGSSDSYGNSIESMFELQFPELDNRKNEVIHKYYGQSSNVFFSVNANGVANTYGSEASTLMKRDSRMWYSCQDLIRNSSSSSGSASSALQTPYMLKWANCNFIYDQTSDKLYTSWKSSNWHNWIIYRMTDVMLMMAEAYVCRAESNGANDPDMRACKNIVDAIHKRSAFNDNGAELAAPNTTANRENYIKLVMNERMMEFLGEGKRWFDLVRYAERYAQDRISRNDDGEYQKTDAKATDVVILPDPREPQYVDGTMGVRKMVNDYLSKAYPTIEQTLKNRLKNRYGLYSPIYYMEKKANRNLIDQNPVWNREK
ncbi:MAG: RagB/SusD family nutrient uptake outer membrane protein [Bacteroidaceae bacterium]|nr:RagB/SusD family nutrient uptake outer membrane protein [Bacteroidaceae bacterium]